MTAVVVKAVTPDREIAWNDISRISNSEMKELMIDAVNRCDRLLGAIFASDAIVDALKDWNDPNWYDQLTLEDVDQLDEPTRKKASYSKLSAMQMSSRYVRCAPNVADDRSCDHHAERSSVLGSCFWPLIVRRSHRSIHCWHDRAARRSALPRERFSPMTQLRHGPDPLLKPVGCTSNSPSRSRLLYFRDYTGMVCRRHMPRGGTCDDEILSRFSAARQQQAFRLFLRMRNSPHDSGGSQSRYPGGIGARRKRRTHINAHFSRNWLVLVSSKGAIWSWTAIPALALMPIPIWPARSP